MQAQSHNPQKVSVVIPVYNATATLTECLSALVKSDYPNFDIWVIDDGSTDASLEMTHSFTSSKYPMVHTKRKVNGGSASAKNLGARLSQGDFLYFLDADVVVEESTLSQFVQTAVDYQVALVVGRYSRRPMNQGFVPEYKAIADYVMYLPKQDRHRVAINHQLGGGGDFFLRRAFEALGGFNESIAGASVEREELYLRFYQAHFKSAANPNIKTRHYFPQLPSLVRNYTHRIRKTVALLGGKRRVRSPYLSYLSYLSWQKSVFGPLLGTSSVLLFPLVFLDARLNYLWIVSLSGFFFFNRELLAEFMKRKGSYRGLSLMGIHLMISVLIVYAGISGVMALAFRKGVPNGIS